MTIRYASRGTSEVSKKIAEWMKQQWESVLGINIEIDMMEWNIMWDKIDAGDYDIAEHIYFTIYIPFEDTMNQVLFFSYSIRIMDISTQKRQDGLEKILRNIRNF